MKNKEFVSRVVNGIKSLNKDTHISRRYILGIGKAKAKFLMSQKLDELSLFKEDGIIQTVSCFELKKIKVKECDIVEFRLCKNLMKSKQKLPETIFGKIGIGIISVTNLDGTIKYDYATPNSIMKRSKRQYSKNVTQKFYYIRDGYLYLPESEVESVEITLFALDESEVIEASGCKSDDCKSAWENEFICPDRFVDLVLRETVQEVASIYRTSIADENPNLDENQKSQTTK